LLWQEMQIVRNLITAVGDTAALGVEAGMRYHLTTHGVWGFALSSCPTVRSAIEVGLRYVDLTFAFTEMSLVTEDDHVRLLLDPSHLPLDAAGSSSNARRPPSPTSDARSHRGRPSSGAARTRDWFNPNLLNAARRAWSAAMLFEAVTGCGSLNPCRLLADYLLACRPGHRRPCGEWLKRGLRCRKLVCPPRFSHCVEARRDWCRLR
jgi:hypothetical protein